MSEDNKPLSGIIKAEAKMAMPEIVSVFLSKYETELYEKKAKLTQDIADAKDDYQVSKQAVADKADFSKQHGKYIKELKMYTNVTDIGADLEEGVYRAELRLTEDKEKSRGTTIKSLENKIAKSDMTNLANARKRIQEMESDLAGTLAKISDMSRKERQVKARISEMRLEEQGLQNLLGDQEMLKLIQI